VTRAESEAFFIFGEEDFAWEEPGSDAAAVALPLDEPPYAPPRRRRPRPRQTRTFAGDLARIRERVHPAFLAFALLAAVAAAVGLRLLTSGGDEPRGQAEPAARRAQATPVPVPATPTPKTVVRTLEPEDTGGAVRDLQAALAALGFYAETPDGGYGPATSSAVSAFQGDRGLTVDGVAGPDTARSLVAAVAEDATDDVEAIERGLAAAVGEGRLEETTAKRYGTAAADALERLATLPPGRAATVGRTLNDLAAQADAYDEHRALALFAMLETVAAHMAANPLPPAQVDVRDADGVVYRYLPAYGFQFHPLANFAHLNGAVRKRRLDEVRRLAPALAARGVPVGDALTWEYYFPFGGPSRWTSGLAQAAGAQALARAGRALHDPALLGRAAAAYRAIPQTLSQPLAGGLWVREYSFSDMAILNAQLQTIVSLSEYADIAGDAGAVDVAARMSTAAQALLPQFDTGCWSRYSLNGSPASDHYHRYHVSLLETLARDTGDPVWQETGARWKAYLDAGGC